MSAKVSFKDVSNNELALTKLDNRVVGFTNSDPVFKSFANTSFSGTPGFSSQTGSVYLDSATGDLYRTADGATWTLINSLTKTVLAGHVRTISVVSVTSGDAVFGDLVGIYGTGAFAASSNTNVSRFASFICGNAMAALIAGGETGSPDGNTKVTDKVELFNGSSWTNDSNKISAVRRFCSMSGGQNGALIGTGTALSYSEIYNGTVWANAGNTAYTRTGPGGGGTYMATALSGSKTTTSTFNGSVWTENSATISIARDKVAGCGSQNSLILFGGGDGSNAKTVSEIFNGSAWLIGSYLPKKAQAHGGSGTSSAALMSGGSTNDGGPTSRDITSQIFNGTSWAASGNLSSSTVAGVSAGGPVSSCFVGGTDSSSTGCSQNTQLHTQSTYRKLYPRHINEAKNIGIQQDATTVILQGSPSFAALSGTPNLSVTWPANKFYVVNRYAITSAANEASFAASLTITSVQGTPPTMTYNFSSATTLSLQPGMTIFVVANGATPIDTANTGSFIISRVPGSTSFEVQNSSGVATNPGTGYINVIGTMLAVDQLSPNDIVVGQTDAAGTLRIMKPVQVGSAIKRLK